MKRVNILAGLLAALIFSATTITRAENLTIQLIPDLDTIGSQIETVQVYTDASGSRLAGGIYDTGASVITYSALNQILFDFTSEGSIPVLVPGGAEADAIGGIIIGDVSQPGTITVAGLSSVTIDLNNFNISYDFSGNVASAQGIQAFLGTDTGSPSLPTISGTPIHTLGPSQPLGKAALISMTAYELDLGALFPEFGDLFDGIVFQLPDLEFVDPGITLPAASGFISNPARIPVTLFGADNLANPGNEISFSFNPVVENVQLENMPAAVNNMVGGKTLLFDTGAMLSIVSPDIIVALRGDLNDPYTTISVQGAANSIQDIPGFLIDALVLPRDDDGDGIVDGEIRFENVVLFALDIIDGIDGILGMNLFNTADTLIYDPHDPLGPSVSVNFNTDPNRGLSEVDLEGLTEEELSTLNLLADVYPGFGAAVGLIDVKLPTSVVVPEPSALTLAALAMLGLCFYAWRCRVVPHTRFPLGRG